MKPGTYYAAHREVMLIRARKHYRENREKALARMREYYQRTKEERRAKQLAYYQKNKETIKANSRAAYQAKKARDTARCTAELVKENRAYHAAYRERLREEEKRYTLGTLGAPKVLIVFPGEGKARCGQCAMTIPVQVAELWAMHPHSVHCPFCRKAWGECWIESGEAAVA